MAPQAAALATADALPCLVVKAALPRSPSSAAGSLSSPLLHAAITHDSRSSSSSLETSDDGDFRGAGGSGSGCQQEQLVEHHHQQQTSHSRLASALHEPLLAENEGRYTMFPIE